MQISAANAAEVIPGGDNSAWSYWIGATMKKGELDNNHYGPKVIPRNGFMRIFPDSDGLPPSWDDPRLIYCRDNGVVPFLSSNINGDSSKFREMRERITAMPDWVRLLLLTDQHEPERHFWEHSKEYIDNYKAWWRACITELPADKRKRVKAGPVLTLQWIEDANKGKHDYGQYDPGPEFSDLYAIDMYMNSWDRSGKRVADEYPDPVTFLSGLKSYRDSSDDHRPRIIAELGAIGIPSDPAGRGRAAWLNGICKELDTWKPAKQGWPFWGLAWWNTRGTDGSSDLDPIGKARYFYLDKFQNSNGTPTAYADPAPLEAFNAQAARHHVRG
ncbi:hypothetical protein BJ973_002125 [Actinoplanes tereljensis]|uniref:GH26 domain-containing protein n=1 Tax=Paractinoplanes tereljensis TaxID=571912 RepID=A0A919TT32_9ACTN|nr:hypothetical protein [Actinoplanes tereljensis]GIF19970.1 hypothetical protein Ate02nite_27000 [Actinoplanes tereljensis]